MKLNVLFLDDEVPLCEIFIDFFSSPEVNITVFSDPQLAIDYSLKNELDLIFLDYRLPSTNGDQVALKMPPSVPKFLLTGEFELKSEYTFQKIFKKPFKAADISQIIDEFLEKKRSTLNSCEIGSK